MRGIESERQLSTDSGIQSRRATLFNSFLTKISGIWGIWGSWGSWAIGPLYGSQRATVSDTDLGRYAQDERDPGGQGKRRKRGSKRGSQARGRGTASRTYYDEPEEIRPSSRNGSSGRTTPQSFERPGPTLRIYQQYTSQPNASSLRRSQSMFHNQAPDPDVFTQHLTKTTSWRGKGDNDSKPPRTIYFYEKGEPYYSFTNFSPHPVRYDGKEYPTSEHLFQALKFLPHRPQLAEHIRTAGKQPTTAFTEARRFAPEVRTDWRSVNLEVMDLVLEYKFTQHPKLMKELLATGEAKLVEDARENDAFWGNGPDGKGLNHLGYALMKLRDKYRRR